MWNDYSTDNWIRIYYIWRNLCNMVDSKNNTVKKGVRKVTQNKRFYMDKSGDLYDRENKSVMVDFGYSYDGVGCKRIIDLLNELNDENEQLKKRIFEFNEKAKRFINNPNERPIRTNEDYWVGVNNITSFLMEMIE